MREVTQIGCGSFQLGMNLPHILKNVEGIDWTIDLVLSKSRAPFIDHCLRYSLATFIFENAQIKTYKSMICPLYAQVH